MTIGRNIGIIMIFGLLTTALPTWAQRGRGPNAQQGMRTGVCRYLLNAIPEGTLDSTEAAELAYLREEEKLARDVYSALYSKWGMRIFQNISQSEQRHSDALALLLSRYGLSDPAANMTAGNFENRELQALYSDLVIEGQASISAALRVGATIEDLDLHDLEKASAATDNDDLKAVYQNLQRGTGNHLRTFIRRLEAGGEDYAARYVSAATLANVVSPSYGAGTGYGRRNSGPKGTPRGSNICPWGNISAAN